MKRSICLTSIQPFWELIRLVDCPVVALAEVAIAQSLRLVDLAAY